MPDDRGKLKKLHENLVRDGYALPDYGTFEKDMADSNNLKKLYGTLLKDGYELPDEVTFRNDMGYGEEPKKKTENWFSDFFTGSKNGNSPSSSIGGALGKTAEISPPTGRAITTGGTFKKNERPFDQTKEEAISGATKKLSDIMYGDGNDWKDPIKASLKGIHKSKSIKETLDSYGAKVLTEESLMPNGYDAKRVLSSSHFGQEGDDNLTSKALRDKVVDYEKTVAPFRGINPKELTYLTKERLYDAAIRAYANKNENFKKQLEASGIDLSKDDIALSLGDNNAKKGQIMSAVLQNPDLQTFLQKENPNLIPAIQDIQENLIYDNKDFGKVQLANEISRDMQNNGYNKIDPVFNLENSAKKTGDVTAESLYANDPKKLQFYRENKDEILNKLDAPSLFTGFAEASKGFGKGILNTFTQPFTSTSKTIKEGLEKEASHVSADPKGLVKFLSDSGHALGFVAAIGATGNVAGLTGMGANAAELTSLGVGFLGDNLEQAKMKYPDSPVKQWTSALFNTGLFMAMGKSLFPAAKVEQALTKVQPEVSKVIDNLTSGKITREAARAELNTWGKKAIDIAGEGLQKNIKVSAEYSGIGILNKTLDKLMGMDDQTFEQYHPEGEEADTFKSMFLSNIIVNGMAAYGQAKAKNNIAKESVYEAVNYPNRYRSVIEGAAISKNIAETKDMLDNLDYLVGIKKDLDTRGLSEKQKKDYLFNALKSRVLNASKPASPDATLTRQHSERIKDIEEINQGILEGKDADEVVTTSEQKKIDEQDKNDTELERLTKAKELDQKEYDEKRGELDGRRPEDRIKIEKLEQAQKEKNEDYDKKIAKLTPKVEEPITLDQDRDLMDEGSEFESRPKEEILVDVPDAANGIADKGVREAFLTNPERGLAEVAQQLHSTTGEAETASNTYGNKIADLALELYPTRESADKALTPTPKGNTSNVGGDVIDTPEQVMADKAKMDFIKNGGTYNVQEDRNGVEVGLQTGNVRTLNGKKGYNQVDTFEESKVKLNADELKQWKQNEQNLQLEDISGEEYSNNKKEIIKKAFQRSLNEKNKTTEAKDISPNDGKGKETMVAGTQGKVVDNTTPKGNTSNVGGDVKPTPQKVKVLGKDVNMYNDYIPSKVEDVEPDAMYSFNANSKDGIPSLLHDIAYANKREVNGVKSENWHASISGEDLLKLYPKEQSLKETTKEQSLSKQESGGKAPVTKSEGEVGDSVEATAKALESADLSKMPNVSFHGSKNKELIFGKPKEGEDRQSKMQLDFGTHFTDEGYASFYSKDKGKNYPAIIDLKKPLDLTNVMSWKGDADYAEKTKLHTELGLDKTITGDNYYDKDGNKHTDVQNVAITANKLDRLVPKKVSATLKANGYDGIIYEPYHPAGGSGGMKFIEKKSKSYIVLDNSSIKEVNPQNISEAYHKAKSDGSNPELVKAVENIIGKQKIPTNETKQEPTKDIKPEQADKVKELEAERDMAILREKVPEMKDVNDVVPTREAVSAGSNADNLTANKRKRAELKNRYTELQKLLGCLTK